jgi:hypothetical protein
MKTLLLILIFGIGAHAQTPDLQKAASDARIAALELKVQEQALKVENLERANTLLRQSIASSDQAMKAEQAKSAGLQDTASTIASERDTARAKVVDDQKALAGKDAQIALLTNERDLLKKQLTASKRHTTVAIIAAIGLGIARIF